MKHHHLVLLCMVLAACRGASAAVDVVTNGLTVTVTSTELQTFDVPFFAPAVSNVAFSVSGGLYYYPVEDSTYTGGTDISNGQLYLKSGGALGTGPVTIGVANESSILTSGFAITIPNKVVFGPKTCYVAGMNSGGVPGCITLKSVGVVESGSSHTIRLGRVNAGSASTAVLSLTDPASEPIEGVRLSGALSLTLDGGTLKARDYVYTPFFQTVFAADTPDVSVSTNGITFEIPAKADVRLGVPLKFTVVPRYDVLETVSPANGSFESGLSPWAIAATPPNTETGGVQSNGSAFDTYGTTEWHAPDGAKYAMLRHDAVLSTTVNVPSDGLWRVRFWLGCRPCPSPAYSAGIRTDVRIDGATVFSVPALTAVADLHPFIEIVTDPFTLAAGADHTLAFANVGGQGNGSMNFDKVTLERVAEERVTGVLSKTGEGRLSLTGQAFDGVDVSAAGGVLALYSSTLSGMTLSVASGAAAALHQAVLGADATVDVASGGTLRLSGTGTNIVVNGGFEAQQYWFSATQPTGWTLKSDPETANNVSEGVCGSGIIKNDTTPSVVRPMTPYGNEAVFLREYAHLSQTVAVPEAGTYRISFVQACRDYYTGYAMPLAVKVDGGTVLEVAAHDANYGYERHACDVELTAGDHVLTFSTAKSPNGVHGEMVFIDDVSVAKVVPWPEFGGALRLASGATLDADAGLDIRIVDCTVNGAPLRGGRSAAAAAGITVTGAGDVHFGKPRAVRIIVR